MARVSAAYRCPRGAALLALLLAAPLAGQTTTAPPGSAASDSARVTYTIQVAPPSDTVVPLPADSAMGSAGSAEWTAMRARARSARAVRPRGGPSPLVAQDHWAVRAARRAEALGLAPGYLPAQTAVPRHALEAAFRSAADRAHGQARVMAEGWRARFVEEFPEYADSPPSWGSAVPLGRRLDVEYTGREGRLSPTVGYSQDRQDPRPVEDEHTPAARATAGLAAGRFAAWGEARVDRDGAALPRWEAAAGAGPFSFSVGSHEVGYGPGLAGAVVLYPGDPLLRFEAQTARPIRLPWLLRYAGDVSMHLFFGPMRDPGRHPDEAWLWGGRMAVQPHPRLTVGANRSSIFGTQAEPIAPWPVVRMLAGVIVQGDFENQVASLDARWRLPTDALLPMTVYAEVGADDGAGAFDEMPGILAGLFLPSLPGVPQIAVGAEHTRFPPVCCGHGPWYFNATQRGGWARRDLPLGHPLGGQGWEALGYAQADLLGSRLRIDARGFVRERSGEGIQSRGGANLFAPTRAGRSTGGALDAAFRVGRMDLRARYFRDAGDGWREQSFQAGVAAFF